jgi:TolB protein
MLHLKRIVPPVLVLWLLMLSTTARAAVTIEIFGGAANKIPVAVMPFAQGTDQPTGIADIIGTDLQRSGYFRLLDTRNVSPLPTEPADVDYSAWSARKADYLVIGRILTLPGGRLEVRFRLMDVVKKSQLLGLSYAIAPAQYRATAHKIADTLIEKITGEPGVFSSRIAYVLENGKRYQLKISDSDGYNAQTVLSSPEPIISPSWSPDGGRLAYVSFEDKKPVVYVQNLVDGVRQAVANYKGSNSAPAWSPDGSRLALVLSRDQGSQIYLMSPSGGGLQRLTYGGAIDTEPVWTPDGKWILFTSDRSGSPQIYRIAPSGGDVQRLTYEGSYNVSPAVSPDGTRFAFIHRRNGLFHVALQEFASGSVQVLTDTPQDESPSFASNGKIIIYATIVGGRGVLETVTTDGRTRQRLLDQGGDAREPVWAP